MEDTEERACDLERLWWYAEGLAEADRLARTFCVWESQCGDLRQDLRVRTGAQHKAL